MTVLLHRLFAILAVALLLAPPVALSFGALPDIRYKLKPADGNRIDPLLGNGRIVRGGEAPGKIAFTFDDGPDHRTTPVLLDQLDRWGVKGTFFVNGHRFQERTAGAEENRAVLRDIHRRGHFIGTHTFSHADITALDDAGWKQEVTQVARQVEEITGRLPRLFRPPFGRVDDGTAERLRTEGYTVVMWNLDPLDWKSTTAGELLSRAQQVVEENPGGGIFLFHEIGRAHV